MHLSKALLFLSLLTLPCIGANARTRIKPVFIIRPQTTVCITAAIDPYFVEGGTPQQVGDGISGVIQRALFDHERNIAKWIKYEMFLAAADATWSQCQQPLDILIRLSVEKRTDGSAYRIFYYVTQEREKFFGVYERDLQKLIDSGEVIGGFGGDKATDMSQDIKGLAPLLWAKLKVVGP